MKSPVTKSWESVMPQFLPSFLTEVLGQKEAALVESYVFAMADKMVEGYCGGIWRVDYIESGNEIAIRWVLDGDEKRYTVSHAPNQVSTTMSAVGLGTTVTLFALYAIAAKYQSEKAYAAYCRLVEQSRELQEWAYIARMID